MKEKIEEKLKLQETQMPSLVDRFLSSMRRIDRDRLLCARARAEAYKEILKEL